MQKKRWTERELEKLVSLYQQGFSAQQISHKLGRSLSGINKTLCRYRMRTKIRATKTVSVNYTYSLFKVFPFAHKPLHNRVSFSYLRNIALCMHQPIILSKGHTKSAFPQLHEIPQREQGETLSPFRWLNRYTPYTVHQCKHPKLDKALYRVITHHNEKKYVNYEAVITLANHYREKLGLALFEEYVDHTQPPLHRLSGKTV